MTDELRARLQDGVQGPVLWRGDDGYDDEVRGFQTAYAHRPDVVVGATGPGDVQAAVRYALDRGVSIAVQSTGHGVTVTEDGGVLVTTGRLGRVTVDPATGRARIGAGARWRDVAEAAAPHGLIPPSGSAPHVGVAGYTLAGGMSLLGRQLGYAADRVTALTVVTADAEVRRVTADSDPDLFWALRGGRDNFGIVTELEIELLRGDRIWGGGIHFDASRAAEVLELFRTWSAGLPDTMTPSIGMLGYPPIPALPEPLRGRHVVHVRFASTDLAGAPELARPFLDLGDPVLSKLGELPYTEAGSIYGEPDFAHAYTGNNVLLGELDAEALADVPALTGPDAPVPCIMDLRQLGGAFSRPPEAPNAVPFREAAYVLRVLSPLDDQDPQEIRDTHARFYDRFKPWTIGRSLNFVYGRSGPTDYTHELYDSETLARLTALKKTYDPGNVFRCTQNIPPA
ncbi:FAD-binding oxidoreductase [Actinomadura macrotermitis]|uniref:Mitomycin radical oxidase n=1 Tax=Actinomadura macrotermitis TaxID=2585200 RepID=A0A7K0BZ46_9ACTN|nr:Mitomycin radical oxidase [Actinomadura macrotermitis]